MSDSATKLRLDSLQATYDKLLERVKKLETEMESKPTTGAVQTLSKKIDNKVDDMKEALNRVESKVQNILSPDETIAFLGAEDLRSIKTHLRQLFTIKQELDQTKKVIIDLLLKYDAGQAKTLSF